MRHAPAAPLILLLVASPAWAQSGTSGDGSSTSGMTGVSGGTAASSPPAAQRPPPQTAPAPQTAPPPTAQPPREEDGDGRAADLLWIEGFFGYSYVDLVQFSQDNFLPRIERRDGSGWTFGAAAGVRLSFLMLGGRGTLASYPGFDLWTVTGEVHLRLPVAALEPYFRLGFGYGWVGQANYDVPEASEASIYGLVVDGGAGLDIYLDKIVAIGAGIDGVWLNLSRQRIDQDGCETADCMVGEINFREDGDAAGLQLRLHAHASLHF